MMGIRAGALNCYVSLQDRVAASPQQFDSGEPHDAWVEVAKIWAAIDPVLGREFSEGGIQAEANVKIRIRWRDGLHAGMRIVHQGKIYDLTQPLDVGTANREVLFYCGEGATEG
jgi:SPP1 family predicted phage head-tail adaptor